MVISDKYNYVFIELPHTASTAINKELRAHYDGSLILRKHAYYHEFLKVATPEQKKYFVFSGIRNPLDIAVTNYLKFKNNHDGIYTDPTKWARNGGYLPDSAIKTFQYIQDAQPDFATYFLKCYRWPYDDWSNLAHKSFNFIIRYENLQEDFATVLKLLKIEQVRPLPVINKTTGKTTDFSNYYNTPEVREHARQIFGPFLKKWGYEFPPEWNNGSVPLSSQVKFHCLALLRRVHWGYMDDRTARMTSNSTVQGP